MTDDDREPCANECRFVTGKRTGQPRPATWNEMKWTKANGWRATGRRVCGHCTYAGMTESDGSATASFWPRQIQNGERCPVCWATDPDECDCEGDFAHLGAR
jgi:hypothetical protein